MLDRRFLAGPPVRLVRVLLQCPRDLDLTSGVLALADVRSGIVTTVRALGEAGRPPVEVELRRVALAAPREIVQARAPAPCRNEVAAVGLVENKPPRPGQAAPAWRLRIVGCWCDVAGHRLTASVESAPPRPG